MFFWPKRKTLQEPNSRTILHRLQEHLSRESDRALETFSRLCTMPRHVEDLCQALTVMAKIRSEIEMFRGETDAGKAAQLLQALDETVTAALCASPSSGSYARHTFASMIARIAEARTEFAELRVVAPSSSTPASTKKKVIVPADLLYLAHASLFPPERMVVVAGQRGNVPRFGALFDVTGDAHATHVKADRQRLARALIAFEKSGSYLAGWGHSHPGKGPEATWPSPIDTDQHAAWIRDYSKNLVSFIMVADGFVRFWGTAVESGHVEIEVTGNGITKEKPHVYRLDP